MYLEIKKIVATLMVSILSFLGWGEKSTTNDIPVSKTEENIIATSTVVANVSQTPQIKKATSTQPQTKVKTKVTTKNKPVVKKPVSKTTTPIQNKISNTTPPVLPVVTSNIPFQNILPNLSTEENIKLAVANIYCMRRVPEGIEKITGSAVAINEDGVYLTNAHVALYILLEETGTLGDVSCFIRDGSPAKKMYKAEIVYFPKTWADRNVNILNNPNPQGSGEKDYAIIRAIKFVGSGTPPQGTHYLEKNQNLDAGLIKSSDGYLVGYPAGFSDASLLDSSLYEISQKVSLIDILHFDGGGTNDAVSTSPSLLAERGSSGGALSDTAGKLLGLMVATTIDPYSGQKNMRAITLSYINRDLLNNTGKDIDWYANNALDEENKFKNESALSISKIILGQSF